MAAAPASAAVTSSEAAFEGPGIQVTVPDNSVTVLSARVRDAAQNVSGCSNATFYVEDSVAAAPTITGTNPPSPANDNTPLVQGAGAEAGSVVSIYGQAGCTGGAIATGGEGAFEGGGIPVTVPEDSTTTFSASVTDSAGNPSPCSNSVTYVEDSSTPAPVITDTDPDSPGSEPNPAVKGTAEGGSTVSVFTSGDCTGPAATGSAGDFAGAGIAVQADLLLPTPLSARATDALGNVSGCSAPSSYTYIPLLL